MNKLQLLNTTVHIHHDEYYSLFDIHQASGGDPRNDPMKWLDLDETQFLINEVECVSEVLCDVNGFDREEDNTMDPSVVKQLVFAYAMWIGATFYAQVSHAFTQHQAMIDVRATLDDPLALRALLFAFSTKFLGLQGVVDAFPKLYAACAPVEGKERLDLSPLFRRWKEG